jgi:hypothetical protein
MYIVCIYNAYFMYITKIYIVYTENLDSIYTGYSMYISGWLSLDRQFYLRVYTVAPSWCGLGCSSRTMMVEYIHPLFFYMLCKLYVYTIDIPKLNMEMMPAGQGRGKSLATQTVSFKHLDEID